MRGLGVGIGLAFGVAVMLAAPGAHAITPPLPGAVASPVPVAAPFPAGSMMRILSGYGPNKGSSLHEDTDACCKANDHYALDLVYDDQPSSGLGLPIVASFAGEVVRAGWATEAPTERLATARAARAGSVAAMGSVAMAPGSPPVVAASPASAPRAVMRQAGARARRRPVGPAGGGGGCS